MPKATSRLAVLARCLPSPDGEEVFRRVVVSLLCAQSTSRSIWRLRARVHSSGDSAASAPAPARGSSAADSSESPGASAGPFPCVALSGTGIPASSQISRGGMPPGLRFLPSFASGREGRGSFESAVASARAGVGGLAVPQLEKGCGNTFWLFRRRSGQPGRP